MPTQIASDNFNRANNSSTGMNLGANWTASVPNFDLGINSNQAYCTATTNDNLAYWSANTFHTDQYAQATIAAVGALGYAGVTVRTTGSDAVIGQQDAGSTNLQIYWYNGGAYTQIGSTYTTASWTAGDVARMEADGATYTLYQNGTQRVQGTNASAPKTGYPGLCITDSSERLDDWSGGNLYDNGIIAFASAEESPLSGTLDVSLTIPTGYSNLRLVVATQARDTTDSNRNITGITWNTSENLTQDKEQNDDAKDLTAEIWSLANPTTGTHTASATFAGSVIRTSITAICLASTGAAEATGGASGTSTTPSTSVTTTTNNAIVIDSLFDKYQGVSTPGSGQLALNAATVDAVADNVGVSYERKATAGSVTMDWTNTSDDWCVTAAAYPPYSATSTVKTLAAMGVG